LALAVSLSVFVAFAFVVGIEDDTDKLGDMPEVEEEPSFNSY
jgi:hypothetical protein